MKSDANVASVMRLGLVTAPPGTSIREVCKLCNRKHSPCVVVVHDETPLGIVCKSDCVDVDPETAIDQVMSAPVHVIGAAASVREAQMLMERHNVGVLPVIAGDVLVGLITQVELQLEPATVF